MNTLGRLSLANRSVLITGGCSGMGAATARLAAARGAKVMIASPNPDKLATVADEINAASGTCKWVVCDIRFEDLVQAMVKATVDAFGGLDAAYNNAGIAHGPILTHEVPQELWDRVMAINVTGTYYCCREQVKVFLAQKRGDRHQWVDGRHRWGGAHDSLCCEQARPGRNDEVVGRGVR